MNNDSDGNFSGHENEDKLWHLGDNNHCEKAKYVSSDESEALTPEQVPVLTH